MNRAIKMWFAMIVQTNIVGNVYSHHMDNSMNKMQLITLSQNMVCGNAKDVKGPSRSMKDVNKLLVNVETIIALYVSSNEKIHINAIQIEGKVRRGKKNNGSITLEQLMPKGAVQKGMALFSCYGAGCLDRSSPI